MRKTILGVYDSELETKNVVEGLIVHGYTANEISVVSQHKLSSSDFPEGTNVERVTAEPEDDSVMDKIKHAIIPDEAQETEGVGNRLLEMGVSDREAPMYATDIENGRIVVLVDEANHRGKPVESTKPISVMEEQTETSYQVDPLEEHANPKEHNPFTGIDEETKTVRAKREADMLKQADLYKL